MTRVRILLAAVFLVTSFTGLVVTQAEAGTVSVEPEAKTATVSAEPQALSGLRACLADRHRLDVLFLIDESKSLADTDPDADRVTGIKASLAGLERLATAPGAKVDVDVLLMGFSTSVETAPSFDPGRLDTFQSVTDKSLPSLLRDAGKFSDRNDGDGTDFTIALEGAREQLAAHAADLSESGASACQVTVLFTDGRYDPAGDPAAGLNKLCRTRGVNDALRADGVTLFTVALSRQLTPGDLDFLASLTEGTGTKACGKEPSTANGYLISGTNASSLAFIFSGLFSPGTTPAPVPGKFPVEPGIDGFLVKVSTGKSAKITLTSPDGGSVSVTTGHDATAEIGGFKVEAHSLSDTYVEITGTATGPVVAGKWLVTSSSPSALFSVSLSSTVTPTVTGDPPTLRPGSTTTLPVKLLLHSGELLASGRLADGASLVATLSENGAAAETQLPVQGSAGHYAVVAAVPSDSQASSYQITLHTVLPALDGISVSSRDVVVQLPRGLATGPQLQTSTLDFGKLKGTEPASAKLRIQGDPHVGGCVWVDSPNFSVSNHAADIVVEDIEASSRSGCVQVAPGQAETIKVTIHSDKETFGALSGSVAVHILPTGADNVQVLRVPATGRLDVPADIGTALKWLVILMALAILVPLLLLHVLNLRVAGFTPPARLLIWEGRAEVRDGCVTVLDAGHEVAPPALDDLTYAGDGSGLTRLTRRMHLGGVEFEAVASGSWSDKTLRLFRGPYGTATATDLVGGSTNAAYRPARRGTRLEVPLAIAGSWFFIPESSTADGDVQGRLLVLLSDTVSDEDLTRLLSYVSATLPTVNLVTPATTKAGLESTHQPESSESSLDDPL